MGAFHTTPKQIAFWFAASLLPIGAQAQNSTDAFLFSNANNTITARAVGVGNAMSAVGGDLHTASTNPAGLGIYRRGEWVFSPGLAVINTEATFGADKLNDQRVVFSGGGLGFVMPTLLENPASKWKAVNFGLTFNHLAGFGQTTSFSGVSKGSRLLTIAQNAQGKSIPELGYFEEELAYSTYLMSLANAQDSSTFTYTPALTEQNFVRKSQYIKQTGGINELAIAVAGNYNNRLHIGGTIGINFLRYKEFKSYEELEETGSIDFKKMVLDETREVKGTGINLKLGLLYRINKYFRLSAHVHTPTAFGNRETYSTKMYGEVYFDTSLQKNTYESIATGNYPYGYRTPAVFGIGAAAVIRTYGFISGEVEAVNYANNRFKVSALDTAATIATRQYMETLTGNVQGTYKSAYRVKVGTEWVIKDYRLRAGYQMQTSPYQQTWSDIKNLRQVLSIGAGVRHDAVFFDVAYQHILSDFDYYPYSGSSANNIQRVTGKMTRGHLLLTLGIRMN
jgi:hypothetical protein